VHFYFLSDGGGTDFRTISVDATVGGYGYHAEAKIQVVTPDSTFVLHTGSTVQVGPLAPKPFPQFPNMYFGSPPNNTFGINDQGSADMPDFTGGTVVIVQLGTLSGIRFYAPKAPSPNEIDILSYQNAADHNVPENDTDSSTNQLHHANASGVAKVSYNDSPRISLTRLSYISVDEKFNDYLMYRPDASNGDSIYVPLRTLHWEWGGAAQGDGNTFSLDGEPLLPNSIVKSSLQNNEPTWDSYIPDPPQWEQFEGP
jgi:hypothetical protein